MPLDFNLFLVGDDHEGTILRHDKGWNQMVEMANSSYDGLNENRNYVIHHGDFVEAILMDDYRFDLLTSKKAYVLHQLEEAKKNFWPIRKKIIAFLDGNHPQKLHQYGPLTKYFCDKRLERPEIYGTWASHITYLDHKNRVMFKHFATHGAGTINSYAGDVEQVLANIRVILKRRLKNKFGDTLLNSMGHTHKLIICPPIGASPEKSLLFLKGSQNGIGQKYTRVEKTDGYIHPDFKWYVNTGSFLKQYADMPEGEEVSGYAERGNYDPIELGFAVALVRGGQLVGIRKEVV
jgi:hypothetical protein